MQAWRGLFERWQLLISALVLAAVLLPGLGSAGLLDPWEMDRAAVARRMAAPPRVVVIEPGASKLLTGLEKASPGSWTLLRGAPRADATAVVALQQAALRLNREVAHGIAVDIDALQAQTGGAEADFAGQLANLEQQSRGTAIVLVSSRDSAKLLQSLAKARAKAAAANWRSAATLGWLERDDQAEALWPLFPSAAVVCKPDELAATLRRVVRSPWVMPVHKREGQVQSLPWLDAAAAAIGLELLGPSETAVRLGGALLVLLTGLSAVAAARLLLGVNAAWWALLAFATLPSALGLGRLVTFQAGPLLGATLAGTGLALGAARRHRAWLLWYFAGAAVLFLSAGLAGAAIAAALAVAYLLAAWDWRPAMLAMALGSLLLLAVAASVVLGDSDSALLRGWRFTQGAFSTGPDQYHRDFSWFIGQAGFGLFPWGAAAILGIGRLLAAEAPQIDGAQGEGDEVAGAERWRLGVAVALGVVVPFAVVSLLVRQYNHLVVPVAGIAALAIAAALRDVVAGQLSGRLVAAFVGLSTLLLHREIRKGPDAVTRFFAFDPPMATVGATGELAWPAELLVPGPLHMLTLVAVLAFALGTAKPAATVRTVAARLRQSLTAGWILGLLGILWAADALASLGSKLDVLLKTQAQTINYPYDRLWVTIQDTRPEVLSALAAVLLLLALAGAQTLSHTADQPQRWTRPLLALSRWLAAPAVALPTVAIGAVAVLGSGISKFLELRPDQGAGGALHAGLMSSAFATPVALLGLAVAARLLYRVIAEDSLVAPLARGAKNRGTLVIGVILLWAVAGIGVGASQAAGTWSFPLFLIGCWWLALSTALVVTGVAQRDPGSYGWPLAGLGLHATLVLFGPLAARYVIEAPSRSEGLKYIAKVLVASPDAAGLLLIALVVAVNRWAAGRERWQGWVDGALEFVLRLEKPRYAAVAMVLGGSFFAVGYAWTLLPGLSVHFSQKHLLQTIAESGGAGSDVHGVPHSFAHGAGKSGSDNNFYTQTMPTIEDRQAALALLAGENAATRVVDNAQGGATTVLAVPGWNPQLDGNGDGKRDQPGWFGLASAVEGTQVKVAAARWQPGQWKGAAVWAPAQQSATVVDNGVDSLTLTEPLALVPDDGAKGWLAIDKAQAGDKLPEPWRYSAEAAVQRFLVLPKDQFSELNHAFRQNHQGRHIAVLDAESSRLVLAANFLSAAQPDRNWVKQSLITPAEMAAQKGLRKVNVNFDNTIQLVGYKLADAAVSRSQKYKMTLYWKVLKATPTSWKLFMHPHPLHLDRWPLTNPDPSEDENKPCGGCFQTNHWMAGDIIADYFEQEVPLGTNAGPSEIILGWYNPGNDTRLPLLSATGPGVIKHGDNRATIGHLQIR
jgi:hypothetical protein